MTDVRTHDPVHGADDRPWLHHLDVALIVAVSAIGAALAGPASDLVRADDPRAGEPTPIVLALSDLVFTLCHAVPVIGMVALMAFAVRHLDARALRLGPPPRVAVELALLCGLAAYGAMAFVDELFFELFGDPGPGDLPSYLENIRRDGLAVAIDWIDTVVLFPLLEELFFRGIVFEWLRRNVNLASAFAASAGLFAAYHMDWGYAPSLAVMGLILTWLYWRTNSLWAAVIAHAVYNGAITLSYAVWPY